MRKNLIPAVRPVMLPLASSLSAQPWTCPDVPTWSAASCSFHRAFTPGGTAGGQYHFRPRRLRPAHERWSLEVPDAPNLEILVWFGHYTKSELVARMMADAALTLPRIVLRSLPENTTLSMDTGSSGGAIYWDLPNERSHAIEFDAAFAHEEVPTLDWSFEELLVHEVGHVFDKLHGITNRLEWLDAVAADGTGLTAYAGENAKEDFAETFAASLAVRADESRTAPRLTPAHRERIGLVSNRVKWLDRQLLLAAASRSGRLFENLGYVQ